MPSSSQLDAQSSRAVAAARHWMDRVEQLLSCSRVLRRGMAERAFGHDLTEAQLSTLWACFKAPDAGIGQNELAGLLTMSAAHVSGLVEHLRQRGLIEGRRGADRRRQLWHLTREGISLLQSFFTEVDSNSPQIESLMKDPAWHDVAHLISSLAHAVALPAAPALRLHPASGGQDEACGGAE